MKRYETKNHTYNGIEEEEATKKERKEKQIVDDTGAKRLETGLFSFLSFICIVNKSVCI